MIASFCSIWLKAKFLFLIGHRLKFTNFQYWETADLTLAPPEKNWTKEPIETANESRSKTDRNAGTSIDYRSQNTDQNLEISLHILTGSLLNINTNETENSSIPKHSLRSFVSRHFDCFGIFNNNKNIRDLVMRKPVENVSKSLNDFFSDEISVRLEVKYHWMQASETAPFNWKWSNPSCKAFLSLSFNMGQRSSSASIVNGTDWLELPKVC